jgi:hypothetical protein
MKIKGYVLVGVSRGVSRDVNFYFSRSQEKFVDSVMKLNLSDLEEEPSGVGPTEMLKIRQDYPLIDSIKGYAKIKIKIKL